MPPQQAEHFCCLTAVSDWPLHYACRMGNLGNVQHLVEQRGYNVNEVDPHDASPLYLAALTGHTHVCLYLLEQGARCDRILNVALTSELKQTLKEWTVQDDLLDSLEEAFDNPTHADCSVVLNNQEVHLHRIMVSARCPRMAEFIRDNTLKLPHQHSNSPVMSLLLQYLYTGTFEARTVETARQALELAAYYGMDFLHKRLEVALDRHELRGGGDSSFHCDIVEIPCLKKDLQELARLVSTPNNVVPWSDATLQRNHNTKKCTLWNVHQLFLCAQSEFLQKALLGSFREAHDGVLDLTHMVSSPQVIPLLIQWMYCGVFLDAPSSLDDAVELLQLADVILCPRLITYVANCILLPTIGRDNVLDLLSLARMHFLERLQLACIQVISDELEYFSKCPEFLAVLQQDASSSVVVQEGSNIVNVLPLAADIRRVLHQQHQDKDKEAKLKLLQDIVQRALEKAD